MKKIIALLLAFCLVITTFAACGKQIDNNDPPVLGTGDQQNHNPPADPNGDNTDTDDVPGNADSTGETWNGYDIGFVYENGIEYIWNQLDDDTKANLAVTMNAIKDVELSCTPPVLITEEEAKGFFTLVYNCCTAYTYVGTRFFYTDTDGDGVNDSFFLPYNFEAVLVPDDAKRLVNELDTKLDEIVSAMPDGTEYEKLRYLHDYLIFSCDYGEAGILPFTAYGALVELSATCQGYADALHLLLQRAGFETCFVIGRGDDPNVTHKWNYVHLSDGNWYVLDPTWADPANRDDPDYINYDYFLISDEILMLTHLEKFDNAYYGGSYYYDIPEANSMDMNFHVMEGSYVSTPDEARASITKQVADCVREGRKYIYLRVTDEAAYDNIHTSVITDKEIRKAILDEAGAGEYTSWNVYRGHKDGVGQLTFVLTLKKDGE